MDLLQYSMTENLSIVIYIGLLMSIMAYGNVA